MTRLNLLGQCLALDAVVYYVRPVSSSGPGRKFHSLEIAKQWAAEQQMLRSVRHEIAEYLK